jgi:hypothetical protein
MKGGYVAACCRQAERSLSSSFPAEVVVRPLNLEIVRHLAAGRECVGEE